MPEASGNPATDASVAVLTALVERGVRRVVLCPGSRSQALALVAAELERVGAIELHVRIDERVAGFLALGIALETGVPAPVITTSGTATANLHPAVLEAHHSRVPMIVLTADRPTELRGIRANQTTHQPDLYGPAVRFAMDVAAPDGAPGEAERYRSLAGSAWAHAVGEDAHPGPVHLNLAFRDPLSAPVPELGGIVARGGPAERGDARRPSVRQSPGGRTIVVAGNGAGPDAEETARRGAWPLIAEVSSGSRFGPNLVPSYRELLRDDNLAGAIERVIVFGHPTLSREVPALLRRDDVEVLVVDPYGTEYVDPGGRATAVGGVVVEGDAPEDARAWVGRWVFTGRRLAEHAAAAGAGGAADEAAPDVAAGRSHSPADRLAFARDELAAVRAPVTRRMLVAALWRFTWPHDRLVLGASRLIRELDASVPGKKIPVYSNRGLAGIDGTVSTALGVALARAAGAGVTRVLLGDLALLHDAGALLFGVGERRPTLQVIVGNDGGGTIFDGLEVATTAPTEAFDRVMFTPQGADLAALAAAYGWRYDRATTRGELDRALSAPPAGTSILEVPLPR